MNIFNKLLILVTIFCFSFSAEAARTDRRQARQGTRIKQGVKSGEMTKREAKRATRQQRRVNRAEKKAKSDGTVTAKEKARLEKMQDRASTNIYRMKHNDKKREKAQAKEEGSDLPPPNVEPEASED